MKYRPLNIFLKQTEELKKLIAEYPDYPIVVLCDSEVVGDDDEDFEEDVENMLVDWLW